MARSLASKPNVVAPGGSYPYGRIKDKSVSAGTPVNEQVYGDMHQFFEKMMAEAGVTANGNPENSSDGFQFFTALLALFGGLRIKLVDIGAWNMDTTASVNASFTVAGDANFYRKARHVLAFIRSDSDTGTRKILNSWHFGAGDGTMNGGIGSIDAGGGGSTIVPLYRKTSGEFDDSGFSSTGISRGWLIILYDPNGS